MPILGCSRPNTYFQGIPIFSDCPMRKSKISSSANPGKRLHHDLLKSQILKVIILQNQQQGMSYIDLLLLLAIIYMMIQKKISHKFCFKSTHFLVNVPLLPMNISVFDGYKLYQLLWLPAK